MALAKKVGYGNGNGSPAIETIPAHHQLKGTGWPLHAPASDPESSASRVHALGLGRSKSHEYSDPETPREYQGYMSSNQNVHPSQGGIAKPLLPSIMTSHSSPSSYHSSPPSYYSSSPSSYHSSSPTFYHSSPHQPTPPHRHRILFYHKDQAHYSFTNFSPHPVLYNNKSYPTSEHLFQSFKFQPRHPGLAEHIRTFSSRPSVAFSEARRFQPQVRSDWSDVKISKMHETLYLKFTQHKNLREELLATGDAELVEASPKDGFWGWGADKQGHNELGKCLERIRAQLRN